MKENNTIKDSIFRIGKVTSVEGRTVRVSVDKTKNTSHLIFSGQLVKNVSVGSYIKIAKGFVKIIGKVEGEYIIEDSTFSGKDYRSEKDKISRTLKISLLGFFNGELFERGIKEMPLLDNECYLLDNSEFESVHYFLKPGDAPLNIGRLSLEKGQEIKIGINSLFASHIGIFGNTGSGKSYTLAKIYHELFKAYKQNQGFRKNSKFLLLDFNGEYVDENDNVIVEKDYKTVYRLSTREVRDQLPISSVAFEDVSFWRVVLEATEKTQTPFLRRAVSNKWLTAQILSNDLIKDLIATRFNLALDKKDKELGSRVLVEFLSDLESCLPNSNIGDVRDSLREKLQFWNKENEFVFITDEGWKFNNEMKALVAGEINDINLDNVDLNDLDRLKLRIIFQYYDEIIKGHSNREHLSPLIKRMEKRFEDIRKVIKLEIDENEEKNFSVISLKDVNLDMKKILPLLLCKQRYDEQKDEGANNSYLNIIIDEAHNILSRDSNRESEQWKDYRLETFEEIIKEGRKFGVFLTLASQRPSDISPTIISQLHNFFLHRLINNNDIIAIEKTISYLDQASFEYLSILPTGSCIIAGLAAQVPVVVDIGKIDSGFEPNNKTRTLIDNWG